MNGHDPIPRLRIGIIGSGFIANFHLQALVNVREGNEVMVEATHSWAYVGENHHMIDAFRHHRQPQKTFHDGVAVAEMLMALYRSAEIGQVIIFPSPDLETYVPPVARH